MYIYIYNILLLDIHRVHMYPEVLIKWSHGKSHTLPFCQCSEFDVTFNYLRHYIQDHFFLKFE